MQYIIETIGFGQTMILLPLVAMIIVAAVGAGIEKFKDGKQ